MESDLRALNAEGKNQMRVSSQPEKETITHESDARGSLQMKPKQGVAQNVSYHDQKYKKKCKYTLFLLRFLLIYICFWFGDKD